MSPAPKVRIVSDGSRGQAEVTVDGRTIPVTRVVWEIDPLTRPHVTLTTDWTQADLIGDLTDVEILHHWPPVDTVLERIARHTEAVLARLARLERALNANTRNDIITREALVATKEELLAAVAENTRVDESIVAALDANTTLLRQALEDRGVDQETIDSVVAELTASNADVTEAVVRNTIAETEPPADPIPA